MPHSWDSFPICLRGVSNPVQPHGNLGISIVHMHSCLQVYGDRAVEVTAILFADPVYEEVREIHEVPVQDDQAVPQGAQGDDLPPPQ